MMQKKSGLRTHLVVLCDSFPVIDQYHFQMIANSTMDADSVSIIRDYVNELLLYASIPLLLLH